MLIVDLVVDTDIRDHNAAAIDLSACMIMNCKERNHHKVFLSRFSM